MTAPNKSSRVRRWSSAAVFAAGAVAALVLAGATAVLGLSLSGGPVAFQAWLTAATPWFVLWRLCLYVVGGALYVTYWRPRLRDLQRRQSDAGEAGRQRLLRVERLMVVTIAIIEVANLIDLFNWFSGA